MAAFGYKQLQKQRQRQNLSTLIDGKPGQVYTDEADSESREWLLGRYQVRQYRRKRASNCRLPNEIRWLMFTRRISKWHLLGCQRTGPGHEQIRTGCPWG